MAELTDNCKEDDGEHTFLYARGFLRNIFLPLADTFDMDLFGFAQLPAMLTLRDGATFLFNLEEGAICMSACRGAMSFYTCFTIIVLIGFILVL
jgi:hypothetical protein